MQKEIWKDIEEFDGIYQVSNLGRVRRVRLGKKIVNSVLVPSMGSEGKYEQAIMSINGVIVRRMVSRMVYEAFVGPIPDDHDIDHINKNTRDNRVENLRALHKSINRAQTAYIKPKRKRVRKQWSGKGNTPRGEEHRHSKLTEDKVRDIRRLKEEARMTMAEIAEKFGVSRGAISHIIHRTRWSHVE